MPTANDDLTGRTALVTGAAHGIGRAIAEALVAHGATVSLVDADARVLLAAAEAMGDRALPLPADISRQDEVRAAIETTATRCGGLDILVNNAGICPMTAFDCIREEEWDRVLAVNLKGAFFCCQAALPHLRQSGSRGRIINIASVAGQMGGLSVGAHYAASKAGLIAMGKSLARLLAPEGVTVNCIAPSTTATELVADWGDAVQAQLQAQIPLHRFATPEEVAGLVCFLASDHAAFITGATMDINGGLYLR